MLNINACRDVPQQKNENPFSGLTGPEAIRAVLKQRGWAHADIAPLIGSPGGVSDILAGRRTISPRLARRLSQWLSIPFHVLRRCDRRYGA